MTTMVILAGGTIGMEETSDGLAPKAGIVEELLVDLANKNDPPEKVNIRTLSPLIDSSNCSSQDWDRIAATIESEYAEHRAFVVIHGTDTLAYTSSALCFALEGLAKPVVLTGAMVPLTVQGTDGIQNLSDALLAAIQAPAGVWVQFAGRLLHGARVRKSDSRSFNAFDADSTSLSPCQPGSALIRHSVSEARVAVLHGCT